MQKKTPKHSYEKNNSKYERYYLKRDIPGHSLLFNPKVLQQSLPIVGKAILQGM